MAMRAALPVLTTLLSIYSKGAVAQDSNQFTANHPVKWTQSTAQSTELLKGIPEARSLTEDGDYVFALEDLKGDGTKQIIIHARGTTWCGSAGCLTIVLNSRADKFTLLLSVYAADDVVVMNEKANGYATLRAGFGDGTNMKAKVFTLKESANIDHQAPSTSDVNEGKTTGQDANHLAQPSLAEYFTVDGTRGQEHRVNFRVRPFGKDGENLDNKLVASSILSDFVHSLKHNPLGGPSLDPNDVFYVSDYELATEDLSGDGGRDVILRRPINLASGSTGCFYTIVDEVRDNHERQIFSGVLANDLTVTSVKVNGHYGLRATECNMGSRTRIESSVPGILPRPSSEKIISGTLREYSFGAGDKAGYAPSWETAVVVRFDSEALSGRTCNKCFAGATVTFTNRQTGEETMANPLPDDSSVFIAPHLKPDTYKVSVSFPNKGTIWRVYWVTLTLSNVIDVSVFNSKNQLLFQKDAGVYWTAH